MADNQKPDYSSFDRPEILSLLFCPRTDGRHSPTGGDIFEIEVPVDEGINVGARLHHAAKTAPTILFFHGNGEIVADYDDIAPLYVQRGINFLPVDYRGYGRSTGTPTVTTMMQDCHLVFEYATNWLHQRKYWGPVIVMGRSLGSASAIEIAASHKADIAGLIIESGFAYLMPLLSLMGIPALAMGISEEDGPRNVEKIRAFDKATLIIHAQFDQIIPFSDGKALYEASTAVEKRLLMIPGADHNTIFMIGFRDYMSSVSDLINKTCA